jgi:beta-lactam-binding protein with PASTA domain
VTGARALAAGLVAASVASTAGACGGEQMVVVPGIRSANVVFAYERLHAAGLRVAIPSGLAIESLRMPLVRTQTPVAGARVARGSTVRLDSFFSFTGSPTGAPSLAVVPSLHGRSASAAPAWAERKDMYWRVALPPLTAGDATTLLDNFRIVGQRPRPGTLLRHGYLRGRAFHVTPLVIDVAVG